MNRHNVNENSAVDGVKFDILGVFISNGAVFEKNVISASYNCF